ncbi:hypothetical protein HMN09_00105000 [Mycena chlorophos]|uniref:Uncharacterized protein n=1 Tax=Mycena chlorophos TaxID=658473 RepID=A0A8H6TUV3_MYCCL|nr:hypothetical protein HMN09_00105000 [Mycena chlorophos]
MYSCHHVHFPTPPPSGLRPGTTVREQIMGGEDYLRCSVCLQLATDDKGEAAHVIDAASAEDEVQDQIRKLAVGLRLIQEKSELGIMTADNGVWTCPTCHKKVDNASVAVAAVIPVLEHTRDNLRGKLWKSADVLFQLDESLKTGFLKQYNGLFHLISTNSSLRPSRHEFNCLPGLKTQLDGKDYRIFDREELAPGATDVGPDHMRPTQVVDLSYSDHGMNIWRFSNLRPRTWLPTLLYKCDDTKHGINILETTGIHRRIFLLAMQIRNALNDANAAMYEAQMAEDPGPNVGPKGGPNGGPSSEDPSDAMDGNRSGGPRNGRNPRDPCSGNDTRGSRSGGAMADAGERSVPQTRSRTLAQGLDAPETAGLPMSCVTKRLCRRLVNKDVVVDKDVGSMGGEMDSDGLTQRIARWKRKVPRGSLPNEGLDLPRSLYIV